MCSPTSSRPAPSTTCASYSPPRLRSAARTTKAHNERAGSPRLPARCCRWESTIDPQGGGAVVVQLDVAVADRLLVAAGVPADGGGVAAVVVDAGAGDQLGQPCGEL